MGSGSSFPCSSFHCTDLVAGLPLKDTLGNGENRYFGFNVTRQMIESGLDIVVKLRVNSGYFRSLTIALDENFPSQRRHIWEQDFYCMCTNPQCDYVYPHCLNETGGICTQCMLHDENYNRLAHDHKLGGLAVNNSINQLEIKANGAVMPKHVKSIKSSASIDHSGAYLTTHKLF